MPGRRKWWGCPTWDSTRRERSATTRAFVPQQIRSLSCPRRRELADLLASLQPRLGSLVLMSWRERRLERSGEEKGRN